MNDVQNIINNSGGELWTTYPFSEAYKNALSENAQKDLNPELKNYDPINDPINALKTLDVINAKNTISMDEMAVSLQVSHRYLANLINDPKNAGIIRRVGSVKSGHWEIVWQSIENRFLIKQI